MEHPLVSICIPTYNRAEILRKSLDTYVNNKYFNEEIEIVISDNASTDSTKEVGEEYSTRYPNIKYYRNVENIRDRNFPLSMDRATGEYIKLMKDNIIMSENGLEYLVGAVKKNLQTRKPLFFTNGFLFNKRLEDNYMCDSFDDFIVSTSYRVTSITFFGCWIEQWPCVIEREKYSSLQLAQDDWVYQLVEKWGSVVLYTRKFFSAIDIGKRKGYNWFEVHVTNYYRIMQDYIDKGLISTVALNKEKVTYLKNLKPQFVHKFLWRLFPEWEFDMSGANHILSSHFGKITYFYFILFTLPLWGCWEVLKITGRKILIKTGIWKDVKRILFKEV